VLDPYRFHVYRKYKKQKKYIYIYVYIYICLLAAFGICGDLLFDSATRKLVKTCNAGSLKVPNISLNISVRLDGFLAEIRTGYVPETSRR
jgi:hypothetical protein